MLNSLENGLLQFFFASSKIVTRLNFWSRGRTFARQPGGLWFKSHILFPQLMVQWDYLSQVESKVCGRVGYGRSRKKQEKDDLTDSNLDQVEICLSIDIVE